MTNINLDTKLKRNSKYANKGQRTIVFILIKKAPAGRWLSSRNLH